MFDIYFLFLSIYFVNKIFKIKYNTIFYVFILI